MIVRNELIDSLWADYKKPADLIGEHGLLKRLTKRLIERALEAEMAEHLGYGKHEPAAKSHRVSRLHSHQSTRQRHGQDEGRLSGAGRQSGGREGTAGHREVGEASPSIIQSWRRNGTRIIPFFDYPPEIRKVIYTTHAIEGCGDLARAMETGWRTITTGVASLMRENLKAWVKSALFMQT